MQNAFLEFSSLRMILILTVDGLADARLELGTTGGDKCIMKFNC
jgi:hypothetical protein